MFIHFLLTIHFVLLPVVQTCIPTYTYEVEVTTSPTSTSTTSTSTTTTTTSTTTTSTTTTTTTLMACPSVWDQSLGNGYEYCFVATAATYDPALAMCMAMGASLPSIADQAERIFIRDLAPTGQQWLGANRLCDSTGGAGRGANCWEWLDGTPWTFFIWSPAPEPSGTRATAPCLGFNYQNAAAYSDESCFASFHYVCKRLIV